MSQSYRSDKEEKTLETGVAILDDDLNFIKSIFNEDLSFEYDDQGNIAKIIKTTKDASGKTKTVTILITYDEEGNITGISKEVS